MFASNIESKPVAAKFYHNKEIMYEQIDHNFTWQRISSTVLSKK